MAATTIVIVVELDPAGDCPRGTAGVPGGDPVAFHGWLALAETITVLSGAAGSDDDDTGTADAQLTHPQGGTT